MATASQDPTNPVPAVPAAFSTTVAETVPAAQFFKTAICKFWRETGTCMHGENCSFAHGEEEKQPLYKVKLCNHFLQGHCARGANCTFAHGVEELQAGLQDSFQVSEVGKIVLRVCKGVIARSPVCRCKPIWYKIMRVQSVLSFGIVEEQHTGLVIHGSSL